MELTPENKTDLYISVSEEVFNAIGNRTQNELTIGLDEDNKEELIHAKGEAIVIVTEEMPYISYGAYLYNGGEFPYVLQDIKTLHVINGNREYALNVTDITTEPTNRFSWDENTGQGVADPKGDGCMWEITYHFK